MPYRPKPVKERLREKSKVDLSTGCWNWQGSKRGIGYGRLNHRSRTWVASPLSYVTYVDSIPKGLLVCHRCDNPGCINPKHLFLGTHYDNNHDMINKNRSVKCVGEANGTSKLTGEQAKEIKRLLAHKKLSQREIASMFNVSQTTISDINIGKNWREVAPGT